MDVNKISNQGLAHEPAINDSLRSRGKLASAEQEAADLTLVEQDAALDQDSLGQVAERLAARTGLKVEMAEEEESGVMVLRILTPDGGKLLRQIPPEGVLKLAEQLRNPNSEGLLTSLVQ